jgi:hypothetical protein
MKDRTAGPERWAVRPMAVKHHRWKTSASRERVGSHKTGMRERGEPVVREAVASREVSPESVFETLIASAQETGRLAADDVTVALEELELDAGQMDDFYSRLDELQIEVVEATADDEEVEGEVLSLIHSDAADD